MQRDIFLDPLDEEGFECFDDERLLRLCCFFCSLDDLAEPVLLSCIILFSSGSRSSSELLDADAADDDDDADDDDSDEDKLSASGAPIVSDKLADIPEPDDCLLLFLLVLLLFLLPLPAWPVLLNLRLPYLSAGSSSFLTILSIAQVRTKTASWMMNGRISGRDSGLVESFVRK